MNWNLGRGVATFVAVPVLVAVIVAVAGCAGTPAQNAATADPYLAYGTSMAECLQAAGWAVTGRPDGGLAADFPEVQGSAYEEDRAACEHSLGYDVPPPELTDDQIRALYAKTLQTADCLEREGYEPGEPPSEQEYIDQTHGLGGWDPYGAIYYPGGPVTEQKYFELLAICPRGWVS